MRALWGFKKHNQFLWVTANQVGKTVALAAAHIWFNFYKRGFAGSPELIEKARYETLNLSPISRQSKEAFRYIDEILHSNFSWERDGKRFINQCKIEWFWEGKNENLGRVDFSNNASLFCLSTSEDMGAGMAGKQFAFISYDECVQSHHLEEELPARIFSRTAKYSGPIALTSTPDELGKSQQYWYHLYTEAKDLLKKKQIGEWFLVEGLYDENIFISKKNKESFKKRLKKLSPLKYEQVVKGKFIASPDRMFTPEMIEGMWNGKQNPKVVPEVLPDREFVVIIDWGVADAGDETVMGVGDVTDPANAEIVYGWSKQGGDPVELMAMATYLQMHFNNASLVMDTTEMGGVIFKKMLSKQKPIGFGQGNKPDALFWLQMRMKANIRKDLTSPDKISNNKIKSCYLPKLSKQLSVYKLEDKKLKQDWVMMLAMFTWYLEKYKNLQRTKTFPLKSFYRR